MSIFTSPSFWSGVGSLGGAALDFFGGSSAGDDARQAASVQRKWLMKMSNTEVQRRKADLVAAGFNPLLAVGNGASTPTAAPARVFNETAGAANKVASAAAAAASIDLMRAQSEKSRAEAAQVRETTPGAASAQASVTSLNNANAALADMQREFTSENTIKVIAETERTGAETRNVFATFDKIQAEIDNIAAGTRVRNVEEVSKKIAAAIDHLSLQEKAALFNYVIEAEQQVRNLQKVERGKAAEAAESFAGTVGAYLRAALGGYTTGASGAANAAGSLNRSFRK